MIMKEKAKGEEHVAKFGDTLFWHVANMYGYFYLQDSLNLVFPLQNTKFMIGKTFLRFRSGSQLNIECFRIYYY